MPDEFPAITWVEEPPPASGKSRYHQWIATQLKANPGQWAMLDGKAIQPSAVVKGAYSAFRPAGAFEATNRKPLESDTLRTFVRYVGLNPEGPVESNGPIVQRSPGRQERVDQLTRQHGGR